MRDCPIFEVDVTEERTTQIYVAAATAAQAAEIAERIAAKEIDWLGALVEYSTYPYPTTASEHDVGQYGIWVDDLDGSEKGGWVYSYDSVPQLPPEPDPNQFAFDLGPDLAVTGIAVRSAAVRLVPRIQTVDVDGARL